MIRRKNKHGDQNLTQTAYKYDWKIDLHYFSFLTRNNEKNSTYLEYLSTIFDVFYEKKLFDSFIQFAFMYTFTSLDKNSGSK